MPTDALFVASIEVTIQMREDRKTTGDKGHALTHPSIVKLPFGNVYGFRWANAPVVWPGSCQAVYTAPVLKNQTAATVMRPTTGANHEHQVEATSGDAHKGGACHDIA